MGLRESLGDLHQPAITVLGAEVNRGAHGGGAQIPGLLDVREEHLLVAVGIGQQLIVVDLDHKRDLVGVLA